MVRDFANRDSLIEFQEEEFALRVARQLLSDEQVSGNVFSDRSVRAATGLDSTSSLSWRRFVTNEELSILLPEDVVRYDGEVKSITELLAKSQHERSLTAANGPPNTNSERALFVVAVGFWVSSFVEVASVLKVLVLVSMVVGMIMGQRIGRVLGMDGVVWHRYARFNFGRASCKQGDSFFVLGSFLFPTKVDASHVRRFRSRGVLPLAQRYFLF